MLCRRKENFSSTKSASLNTNSREISSGSSSLKEFVIFKTDPEYKSVLWEKIPLTSTKTEGIPLNVTNSIGGSTGNLFTVATSSNLKAW